MRTRRWLLFPVCALVVAACSHAPDQGAAGKTQPRQGARVVSAAKQHAPDLIVAASTNGVTALRSDTGAVLFDGAAVPAMGDWSELFTASHHGSETILHSSELGSGVDGLTDRVRGHLAIRTASFDGSEVALMAPLPRGADPWVPRSRATTTVVVDHLGGSQATERFHLKGNLEPEAFSSDGETLYMIKYLPATDPVAYRVVGLYLEKGRAWPVPGRNKTWSEKMAGTRLQQVAAPNGEMLYTLYSSQPSRYAKGYDEAQAHARRPVAFVHTLNLGQGWAICVGLPKVLWGGNSRDEALAVSPGGHDLYVVDTARDFVADMDTTKPKVVRSSIVHFSASRMGQVHAAVGPDNRTLVVGRGRRIVAVDTRTFRVEKRFVISRTVTGLGWSDDGRRLYASTGGAVEVLDPSTGQELRRIRAAGVDGLHYVGTLGT